MRGAVLVAIAAAIGNMLQGWDSATIAGALLYIKRDFQLETQPAMEGLLVATSLIGATAVTTFSSSVSDSIGRRPMLIASSLLYILSGLMMLWAPSMYVLLLSRLVVGFAVGLAVTLVPVYISETAPPEIRGLLNTLPQFTGSGGMFLSYCMVFAMTLGPRLDWRLMLGVLFLPSLLYLALTLWYLPESPRWLVSKDCMKEARAVLQMLRGHEDVSGEMALLVKGLGTGGDTAIEEYIVGPSEQDGEAEQKVTLFGAERGMSWVAQSVPLGAQGSMLGSAIGLASRQGSMLDHLKDPVVALLGSVHDLKAPGEALDWDDEHSVPGNDVDGDDDIDGCRSDDEKAGNELRAPLLGSMACEAAVASAMGISGGWQLAWKFTRDGPDSGVKRMYLHKEGSASGSVVGVYAAALVSQSALSYTARATWRRARRWCTITEPSELSDPHAPAVIQ